MSSSAGEGEDGPDQEPDPAAASEAAESAPPDPDPQSQSADANAMHPLWQRAAGRGGARGGRGGGGNEPPSGPRFSGISVADLEMRARTHGDGADSSLFSEDEEEEEERRNVVNGGPSSTRRRARGEDGQGKEKKKKKRIVANAQTAIVAAAFGGGARQAASDLSDESEPEEEASDAVSAVSSSGMRRLYRQAMPLKGVGCIACNTPSKVAMVDKFVFENAAKMTQEALYKHAALVYQQRVVEVAAREGVPVPQWSWRQVRDHYTLHSIDTRMQRLDSIRTLSLVTKSLEMELVREDESGDRRLDRQNNELLLKVIAMRSKECSLLEGTSSSASASSGRGGGKGRERD